jgi:hypothetical protein
MPKPEKDNAWLDTDRRERLKNILAGVIFVAALVAGSSVLIYALTR